MGEGQLLLPLRVADVHLHQKPVLLRLRQRVGAFVFDRILGRKDREARRQGMVHPVDRDLALLHRLEQRRLGLGRGAVDFIREEERGEDRPLDEAEAVVAQVEDIGPGDVRGHQVRGELDPGELRSQHLGQRADQQGFGDPGHALEQHMVAGEDRDQAVVHRLPLADDDFGDLGAGPGQALLQVGLHAVLPYPSGDGMTNGKAVGMTGGLSPVPGENPPTPRLTSGTAAGSFVVCLTTGGHSATGIMRRRSSSGVEQLIRNERVAGSIPAFGLLIFSELREAWRCRPPVAALKRPPTPVGGGWRGAVRWR